MSRAGELVRLLYMSADYVDGNEDRNHISGLEHALRVAWLARRHTGDKEVTFAGLVHDLARPLSDPFHGEVIAEMVRDLVNHNVYKLLQTHGDYQSNYIHGTFVDESTPWHEMSKAFCAWEIGSFTKNWLGPEMSIDFGVSLINQVCGDRN